MPTRGWLPEDPAKGKGTSAADATNQSDEAPESDVTEREHCTRGSPCEEDDDPRQGRSGSESDIRAGTPHLNLDRKSCVVRHNEFTNCGDPASRRSSTIPGSLHTATRVGSV